MNEFLTMGMAILDFTAIALLSRFGREWLFGLLGVNMILISATGSKLVEQFGLVTNVGNVFYAAVFMCLFLLVEHYGTHSAIRGIWIGFALLAFYVGMTQFATSLVSAPETRGLDAALHLTFAHAPRMLLASLFAYFISAYSALWLFAGARAGLAANHLWLGAMIAILCAQLIDSILFFVIAFFGTVSISTLGSILLGGFLIKAAAGVVSLPFMSIADWYRANSAAGL